ncbi:MAG: hypothetical protein JXR18_05690 [Neptuniibacter sp.]
MMPNKGKCFIALLFLLACSVSGTAGSDNRVIVSTHYMPPWIFNDCTGAAMEIIGSAFAVQGVEVSCVVSSHKRMIHDFTHNRTNFAFPFPKSLLKSQDAFLTAPFVKFTDVVWFYI